jgi:nickel/cobalt exporter
VASYIFSTKKDIKKALLISLLIGVVHAFSAFILTLVIYFLLNVLLMPFVENSEFFISKLSAIVIMVIASYLLYKKISIKKTNMKFSTHKPSCACSSCAIDNKTTDLSIILSAGLVPCPGTVIIFMLTLSQGLYFVGLMSAVFMSLGMSAVIFIASLISIGIRNSSQGNLKMVTFLEYGAIFLMFLLGLALLIF